MQYADFQSPANQVSKDEYENNISGEKIIILKRFADYIFGREECAFVGQESDINSAEPEALCCDDGATSSFVILVLKLHRYYRTCSSHSYSSRRYCDDNNACLPQDTLCQGSDWGTKTNNKQDIHCPESQA